MPEQVMEAPVGQEAEADPIAALSEEQIETHILKRVSADFDYSQADRQSKDLEVQESRRIFNGRFKDETNKKFGAKKLLFIRKAAWIVRRLVAGILSKYFERQHLARLQAAHSKGTTPLAAEIGTKIVRWHLRNSIKPYLVLEDALLDAAVDNTCCVKSGWDQETMRPWWETIPWEDVFPDPDAKIQSDMRYAVHEKEVDLDYLRKKGGIPYEKGGFKNVDKVINLVGERDRDSQTQRSPGTSDNRQRQLLRIREYWGKLQLLPEDIVKQIDRDYGPRPETVPQDMVVTTYEDKVLLRMEPNTYGRIPLFFGRLLKAKRESRKTIYGESIINMLSDLQREHNSIRNQRRRAARRALSGRIIVGRNLGADMKQLKDSEEGGIVYATDPKEAVPISMPDVSKGFDKEIELSERDFQEASGVTDISQGLERERAGTATEATILATMGTVKEGHMTQIFNLTLVVPLIKFLVDMLVKWEPRERATRIIGSEVLLPPLSTVFDRELDVIVEGGVAVLPTQVQLQQVNGAIQIITPLLQIAPQIAVPTTVALVKKMLDLLPLEDVEQVWEQAAGTQQPGGTPAQAEPGGGELEGRGQFAAAGQPIAGSPTPSPPVLGNAEGGMTNAG